MPGGGENRAIWGALAGSVGSFSSVAQRCHRLNTATVKEEIFVREKFRTFPSKTFRMELNFVLSN